MAYYQQAVTDLTPTRPAPQAPGGRNGSQQNMYSSSNNSLTSAGYSSSFTSFAPSSPSGSSYAQSYTGIGGSPNRGSESALNMNPVRSGPVSIKEDGTFASWIWKLKWLVLKEQTLTIHKSEVGCEL